MAVIELGRVNRSVVVLMFLSLGAALGIVLALIAPAPDVPQSIEWLENPRSLESFSLEAEAGKFDNRSLRGRWTIVLFGFLHCPDICPTSLSQLAELADSLDKESVDEEAAYVFVSVDPGRDSLAEIGRYVRHFDSSIRGVTGSEDQLMKFAGELGIQIKVSGDDDDYSVAHSITFSIIDPEGFFRGRFRPGFEMTNLIRNFAAKLQ